MSSTTQNNGRTNVILVCGVRLVWKHILLVYIYCLDVDDHHNDIVLFINKVLLLFCCLYVSYEQSCKKVQFEYIAGLINNNDNIY